MFKRTSVILLITIALIYVASANDNKDIVKCERKPGDGPNQMCTMELNPVCAYNKGDDEGTTVGNPCGACHQELYDYYTLGECEEDAQEESDDNNSGCGNKPEEQEEESTEEPSPIEEEPNIIMCPAIYDPICGYFNNDTNREHGQTISNSCMAQYYQKYDYYLPGACPEEEEEPLPEPEPLPADNEPVRCNTTGTVFGAVDCTAIYDPICGYFDNDTNRENGKTSSNACNGCFYELWDYYIPGECPKSEPEVHVCNRTGTVFGAVSCLAVYQPVCGYFYNDTERANGQTASNDCNGCFYSLFDYYVDGACKGDEQAI